MLAAGDPRLARHWQQCHNADLADYVPWYFGRADLPMGYLLPAVAVACVGAGLLSRQDNKLWCMGATADLDAKTAKVRQLTEFIHQNFYPHKRWRQELFDLRHAWESPPLAHIDRATLPWLGARAFGLHVNGFVRKADGLHLWVGRRANHLPIEPDKLDNLVGGGQPSGLTLEANLLKEAAEEAAIPAALAQQAKLIKDITYQLRHPEGLRHDTLFIYDLELPEGFIPHNADGEMAAFMLLSTATILEWLQTRNDFKFNVGFVMLDFLARHTKQIGELNTV